MAAAIYCQLFDRESGQWIRLTSEGGAILTPGRDAATVIVAAQLDAYIRNYELDYLRNGIVCHACEESGTPL